MFPGHPLLEVIEEARDRLGLPPGDPARELYELMLDRRAQDRMDDLMRRDETAERDKLAGEVEELRDKLRESKARVTKLERGLRAEETSLRRLQPQPQPQQPTTPAAPAPATTTPSEVDEQERRRLRTKVGELKRLLTERNEERATLRRQLAKASDRMVVEGRCADRSADVQEVDVEEGPAFEPPRGLLTPSFTPSCGAELRAVPSAVGQKTLVTVASLAGGDPGAWRQVKRMAAAALPLFTCRVGIHHRVLFLVADGELTALSVVHRKDLDAAIKRHGRATP